MRRFMNAMVVAATTVLVAWPALAGNQEVAEQIAGNLRQSGQLSDYRITVKYQDGTAWVNGQVGSNEQINAALKVVFDTPGVNRVVNELTLAARQQAQPQPATRPHADAGPANGPHPLRPAGNAFGAENHVPSARASHAASLPESTNIVHRLESAISGVMEQSTRLITNGSASGRSFNRAEQLPTSFVPAPARQVAANEAAVRQPASRPTYARTAQRPVPVAYIQAQGAMPAAQAPGGPVPMYTAAAAGGVAPVRYDQPRLPNYAWPSYAAYPNYAALTYPKQYSPTAWPYIGPFYPYPQVPLGWRKVTLEWDDGWWMLDFKDEPSNCWRR